MREASTIRPALVVQVASCRLGRIFRNLILTPSSWSSNTIARSESDGPSGRRVIRSCRLLSYVLCLACAAAVPLTTSVACGGPDNVVSSGSLFVRITESTYGHVKAQTVTGAACSANSQLPSGRISTAPGINGGAPHTADDSGWVEWTYTTYSSTHSGTGRHTVSCESAGRSGTSSADFPV
jgi:hypothetical protein